MASASFGVGAPFRWGVILAGGDGKRLLPLTRKLTGDERPKQFCAVSGRDTLLQQTLERVEGIIPAGKTMLVLTQGHEPFFREQLSGVPRSRLLVQPENKGTTPAILYSLLRIQTMDPSATIAIFPSDHYISNRRGFYSQIRLAFGFVDEHPHVVVLLGIEPGLPEVSYGWIEPGERLECGASRSFCSVNRFWEKPSISQALELYGQRCLWNSFIMVGSVRAFLRMIRHASPEIHVMFESISRWLGTAFEQDALTGVYGGLSTSSFSGDVLTANTQTLAVLRSSGFEWSDLGEPMRVLELFGRKGVKSEEEYCLTQRACM